MHNMKKISLAVAMIAASAAASTQADIIGASAGAYAWQQSWDGDVQSGGNAIDFNNDLGYDDDNGTSFYVALEHPVPLLPNLRLQRTSLEIDGQGTLTRDYTYDGKTYSAGESVQSSTDLSHTDATMYYEILDNWVNLDVGLSVRLFDGEISITGANGEGSVEFDAPLPMLYGNARFNLPFTGLYAHALANVISVGDNTVSDMTVGLGYEVAVVALELGYRTFDVSLEDDDDEANITVDGLYIGVNIDI